MITIKSFEVNFFGENTYLLWDETREAVIIDCGTMRKEEEQKISTYIAQNELTLKHHLCTHLHIDHIMGFGFVLDTYGVYPEANRADLGVLPSIQQQASAFGLLISLTDMPIKTFLDEGDVVSFGNSRLEILAVPGHSPGSLAFYNSKDGFVITGDALFAGSIGRTDLWGGDMQTLIDSITNKLMSLPGNTTVYPGHGPSTTIQNEKTNNPFLI